MLIALDFVKEKNALQFRRKVLDGLIQGLF
jgi:hypothetical protein